MERYSICIVSGEFARNCAETVPFQKILYQEIRWNHGILRHVQAFFSLMKFVVLARCNIGLRYNGCGPEQLKNVPFSSSIQRILASACNKHDVCYGCVSNLFSRWFMLLTPHQIKNARTKSLRIFCLFFIYFKTKYIRILRISFQERSHVHVKHRTLCENSLRLSTLKYFCKRLQLRCLTVFWM